MHIIAFLVLGLKLGSLLSCGLSLLLCSIFHLFGRVGTYSYGVYTLPRALLSDIGVMTIFNTMVIWIVLGTMFIICFKPGAGWWRIRPYTLSPALGVAGRNMSYTLHHTPVWGGTMRSSFSYKALSLMMTKSFLISMAMFTFIVMPTCTVVAVIREQDVGRLTQRTGQLPARCSELYPDQASYWEEHETGLSSKSFESLCWTYSDIIKFMIVWGTSYGFLISGLCLGTIAIQYGRYPKVV